jgi:hypothetical protein
MASARQASDVDQRVLKALRHELKDRRERLLREMQEADPHFHRRRRKVKALRIRFSEIPWPFLTVENVLLALRKSAARVAKAERKAAAAPTAGLLHRSRRRMRRLRMQLQALSGVAEDPALAAQTRAEARWLIAEASENMPTIAQLSARSDTLGVRNDRAILRSVLRREVASPLREAGLAIFPLPRRHGKS